MRLLHYRHDYGSERIAQRIFSSVTVMLDGVGILFFAALAAYCIRRKSYDYVPGLMLICLGGASGLSRGLFEGRLFSHLAALDVTWRLLNASLILVGGILCERVRRRRVPPRSQRAKS